MNAPPSHCCTHVRPDRRLVSTGDAGSPWKAARVTGSTSPMGTGRAGSA